MFLLVNTWRDDDFFFGFYAAAVGGSCLEHQNKVRFITLRGNSTGALISSYLIRLAHSHV